MYTANALGRPSWYSEGLRWIASLFTAAADRLDRMHGASRLPLEPVADPRAMDDYIDDVRFRMSTRH